MRRLFAFLWLAACAFAAEMRSSVTFNKDILPILQKNCQSCHRPAADPILARHRDKGRLTALLRRARLGTSLDLLFAATLQRRDQPAAAHLP